MALDLRTSDLYSIFVPSTQSQMMWRAMHAAQRPVKLVTLDGDDRWLSRTETRVRMLHEVEAFLRDHL